MLKLFTKKYLMKISVFSTFEDQLHNPWLQKECQHILADLCHHLRPTDLLQAKEKSQIFR